MAYTPAFTRVYVDDVPAVLARAAAHGARIVTEPTDFWGDVLSRFADPFGNLWWVYSHTPSTTDEWAEADGDGEGEGDDSWESFTSPELEYIHSTLVDAMASLKDPRGSDER